MNDTAAQLVADAKWILGADSPDRAVATEGLILSSIVGSTLHGLSVSDGVEDLDIMGICCEPPERALGLRPFEGWIGRTKPAGVRSEIIVVDDASSDDTLKKIENLDVVVVKHMANRGYGAAIMSGIKTAKNDLVLTIDGDGSYAAQDIAKLLE